ncbi:hypothetical protein A9Q84_06235 [Halobacteriovorax marinus]|uniref:SSD domain-containing protein n=1 Tax=Halobacteriovorax marinus TaxID=97084 RepID=A0A1Y5FG24_9BACT|nr:hypothetical protein A9Q84_06235 [Halobacteriovorax marinus]
MSKIFCLVLILFSIFQLKNINIGTDYRLFFGEDNIDLAAFNKLERKFGKNDTILLVVAPKNKKIFNLKTLQLIEKITEDVYKTPYSTRVDSLTNFLHIEAKEDEVAVAPLFESEVHFTPDQIEIIRSKALAQNQLVGKIINKQGSITGINITVHIPNEKPNAVLESADFIKKHVEKLREEYPEIEFHLSGIIIMNDAFATYMLKDLLSLTPLSNLIIFFIIALFFRSFYVAGLVMFISVLANITGMGFAGLTGIKLTPPSGMSTIVILTLSIADCIHILTSLSMNNEEGLSWKERVKLALKKNFKSIFLTSLTTAIGFLCLNFSDAPPYHDLGNISAVGVIAALLYSVILFPYLLSLREVKVKYLITTSMHYLSDFIYAKKNIILVVSTLLTLLLGYFSSQLVINDTFANWFSKSTEFRKSIDYVNRNLTGLYTFEFELETKDDKSVFDPGYLKDLEKFNDWWMSKGYVWHVESINNIMKDINKAFNGNAESFYKLPAKQELAAQLFLFYEMGLPQGFDLNNRVSLSKKSTRMTVTFQDLNSTKAEKLTLEAYEWLKKNTTHLKPVQAQGPSIMFSNISRRNLDSMVHGTVIAFLLITLLLIFSLKSLKLGLISILPNVLPFIITFGIWQILYQEVGLAISIVTSATLGIIIDDTIHIMTTYAREIKLGRDDKTALRKMLDTSGVASITTSVILSLGFSVMLFSDFLINFTFGLLAIISITIAITFDILVLPAILLTFIHKDKK